MNLSTVKDISIKEMTRWHNLINAHEGSGRHSPSETTIWLIKGKLVEYKHEHDSDYHVVIANAEGDTIIVEFPLPDCVGGESPFKPGIIQARRQFDMRFPGKSAPSGKFKHVKGQNVEITGVGFFDFFHGQRGVAPNAVEIHPVLDIKFY